MIRRLLDWLLGRRRDQVHVHLTFESGRPVTLGPMDRFTAEVFIVNSISPHPYHELRRVVSARIIS